jgi:hypothetical protein
MPSQGCLDHGRAAVGPSGLPLDATVYTDHVPAVTIASCVCCKASAWSLLLRRPSLQLDPSLRPSLDQVRRPELRFARRRVSSYERVPARPMPPSAAAGRTMSDARCQACESWQKRVTGLGYSATAQVGSHHHSVIAPRIAFAAIAACNLAPPRRKRSP